MGVLLQGFTLAVLLFSMCQCSPAKSIGGKRVVCYFGSWAVYRYGRAKIGLNDLDPGLCTHFIYTFIGLEELSASVVLLDAYNDIGDDWKKGLMTGVCDKARAAGTKCLVALGGWNEGSEKYSRVTCNPSSRARLVKSIINFVKTYNLDGFDLDWEYPGQRGGAPGDKDCFSALISELRPTFDQNGWVLSAAVSANALVLPIAYNVADIAQKLDFINVMTYDLHGSWEAKTGHNAPLYGRPDDTPEEAHLNDAAGIQAWIDLGAPPSKLNLGMGTYGRSFTLANPQNHGVGAPTAQGAIAPSGWVGEAGFYGYIDICFNNRTNWQIEWDDVQKVPYAYSGNKWVGFDDPLSIREKTCFALSAGLGGVMFWSVETDDFSGICNNGRYPLINAATSALASNNCALGGQSPILPTTSSPGETATTEIPPQPTTDAPAPATDAPAPTTDVPAPTTTVPAAPPISQATTVEPPAENNYNLGGIQCTRIGQTIRDARNCATFYTCVSNGQSGFVAVPMTCPGGLSFDLNTQICNFRSLVTCT